MVIFLPNLLSFPSSCFFPLPYTLPHQTPFSTNPPLYLTILATLDAVLHARFQVSSLSAVEGYFFANYPARVCSTLHELITPYPLYIFPLPCQTKVPPPEANVNLIPFSGQGRWN